MNEAADEKKKVTVIRDGKPREMHGNDLLVGDLVVIREGMHLPADGVVFKASEMTTDESAMTGETEPIKKNTLQFCS